MRSQESDVKTRRKEEREWKPCKFLMLLCMEVCDHFMSCISAISKWMKNPIQKCTKRNILYKTEWLRVEKCTLARAWYARAEMNVILGWIGHQLRKPTH